MKKRLMLATSLSVIAIASTSAQAQDRSVTINSWGGVHEAAHVKCWITPFEQETGATVNKVIAYSADALAQIRAQKESPQFDAVIFSGGQEIAAARDGLLAPIDPSKLSNAADLHAFASGDFAKGVGPAFAMNLVGLNVSESSPRSFASWTDLYDPEIGEHLVLTDITHSFGMITVLMLNQIEGGTTDDITPGINAIVKLLDNGAIMTRTNPEFQQEFGQNEAWVGPQGLDLAFALKRGGLPVSFVRGSEGTPISLNTINMVANRPNEDLTIQLINKAISPEAQECLAAEVLNLPTNSKAVLPDGLAEQVGLTPVNVDELIRFDPEVIDANRAAWTEAFNKAIAR